MGYDLFLAAKQRIDPPTGVEIALDELHPQLFDFQSALVRWALMRGRAAIFADTGLGKTFMQLEWAHQVARETRGMVLIVAPLAVAQQTCREAHRVGLSCTYLREPPVTGGVAITNYEVVDRFDVASLAGLVLDESSILKSHTAKTRDRMIEMGASVPYRLSCSATPSPNDYMELGNQAEFLGVMSRVEMLASFFVHDGGETSKWRLKGHGAKRFWQWMASWAAFVRHPSDLGFEADARYNLPPLTAHEHVVTVSGMFDGELFPKAAVTLSEQRQAQRESIEDRCQAAAAVVAAEPKEPWIVWCHLNAESARLKQIIPGAAEIRGSHSLDEKVSALEAFASCEIRVLVTKASICGFGLNWQHCARMAFVGLSHSFEQYYQATRRCWRFGQDREVHAHLFTAESEGQVLQSLKRKEAQFAAMGNEMMVHMGALVKKEVVGATVRQKDVYRRDVARGKDWTLHLGDCIDVAADLDDESIDYTVFSPPFSSLYTYSASDRDMGNCTDDAVFTEHFSYLIPELLRVTKPGRLLSFHCMNLPTIKQHHGYIGIRDFRGELIRMFIDAGWIFHSEVVIWKDPVTAMQRTKALGLLYKQLRKDSALSRQGIPDFLVTMRKPGENPDPVTKTHEGFPVERWQRYASPVWMDIDMSKTLNFREARENNDERHIAPLQLDVIERAIELWTNLSDLVLSPFAGIGSEGYVAIGMGRRFVGAELKPSYWDVACRNLAHAESTRGLDLFAQEDEKAAASGGCSR